MTYFSRKRNVVVEIGYEDRVLRMLGDGRSPASIVRSLNEDAAFMAKMEDLGHGRVQIGDIHKFISSREVDAKSALVAPAAGSDAAALAVQATKERIISITSMGGSFEALTRRAIYDAERAYDAYEAELDRVEEFNSTLPHGDKARLPIPQAPESKLNSARKGMLACLDILNRLSDDVELKTIVKMQTINVNQGYSEEKVFSIVFEVGNLLGATRDETVSAFSKALLNLKARNYAPIEADAKVEGKWAAKVPWVSKVMPTVFGPEPVREAGDGAEGAQT